jgi:hypothetical protein
LSLIKGIFLREMATMARNGRFARLPQPIRGQTIRDPQNGQAGKPIAAGITAIQHDPHPAKFAGESWPGQTQSNPVTP